ncbi:MAG: N(4)-(beta-N-acetylglucosaminyl)-L-asparaginase [Chloroflexota bacterium]|nr:N(4)-(beta-N-acetylglucosaminyl)-L-asparaginase [Chloroflexota bacterium]
MAKTMPGLVVASSNGRVGITEAVDVLRTGGSALEAVVAGIKLVEANPNDHSVGFSGLPNLLGEVELDASVMVGQGLTAGAVGGLQGFQDAVELARMVMEELRHSLITGEGAARFASEMGMSPVELLTDEASRIWRARLEKGQETGDVSQRRFAEKIGKIVRRVSQDPEKPAPPHGTVNFIARDREGRLAVGVSTSGWAWKYPGRLGDSPIIGAGNYADDRWGAAACTGRGEMAMRCCTAHSVVTFMRCGMSLSEALTTAMQDLRALDDPYASEMNIVAVDRDGGHGAASTTAGKTYIFMDESMESYEEPTRMHVPLVDSPRCA